MENEKDSVKALVIRICAGTAAFDLALALLSAVVFFLLGKDPFPVLTGLFLGCICACFFIWHIARQTETKESDMGSGMRRSGLFRKGIFLAAIFLSWKFLHADMLAFGVGTLMLKPGIYCQAAEKKIFAAIKKPQKGRQSEACPDEKG